MENDKKLMVEYILSNGTFPGWAERLNSWKKTWKPIEKDTVVYRGQGHGKESIVKLHNKPEELLPGKKSVLSTSYNKEHVGKHFTNYLQKFPKLTRSKTKVPTGNSKAPNGNSKAPNGNSTEACCLFEITLKPGIHYFDFNTIHDISNKEIEEFLKLKANVDPEPWPKIEKNETGKIKKITPPATVIYNYLLKKKTEEQEVLVDGNEGEFTMSGSYIDTIDGKPIKIYKVTYAPILKGGSKRRKTRKLQKKGRKTRKN